jgi:hypothetical protein
MQALGTPVFIQRVLLLAIACIPGLVYARGYGCLLLKMGWTAWLTRRFEDDGCGEACVPSTP